MRGINKMANDFDWVKMAQVMKERGMTCQVLKTMISDEIATAKKFREYGMVNLADVKENQIAAKLKELDKRICLLA
jgi:hypothetical protein